MTPESLGKTFGAYDYLDNVRLLGEETIGNRFEAFVQEFSLGAAQGPAMGTSQGRQTQDAGLAEVGDMLWTNPGTARRDVPQYPQEDTLPLPVAAEVRIAHTERWAAETMTNMWFDTTSAHAMKNAQATVSYTHLTLPTICSV